MGNTFRNRLHWHSSYIRKGLWIGAVAGVTYATIEGLLDNHYSFYLLVTIIRGLLIGALIGGSIGFFEAVSYNKQRKFTIWLLLLIKTIFYVLIINLWLLAINALYMYFAGTLAAFEIYLKSSYLLNLAFSMIAMLVFVTFIQIGKLHRKNELFNFIFGKYHNPVPENILLLFVDLKGSTTLAETIGDVKYAHFLKDYYADISEPIFECGGEVYQYVGDEIVVYWKTGTPEDNLRSIRCHEKIKHKITMRKSYFVDNYGSVPTFRASLHTGSVVVTWVGELKQEILFIGDVLNTCARMQEICKRLDKNFLISGQALDVLPMTGEYLYPFEEKLTPRGKQKEILVFSVQEGEE